MHYTCANGCAGGAGSAEGCATCGNVLVHNAAYHPAPGTPAPGSQAPGITAPGQNTPETCTKCNRCLAFIHVLMVVLAELEQQLLVLLVEIH